MSHPKQIVFIPCGHVCCCLLCSDKIIRESRKCPICKSAITSKHKVFIT